MSVSERVARQVRQRARYCCEYCRLPEELSPIGHEIDRIVAEQHGGRTIPANLALACFADNHHKGPNLAGVDPLRQGERVGSSIHGGTSGIAISGGQGRC